MKHTSKTIGEMVKKSRKAMGVTQKEIALTSGTGLRFIIELEKGKPTCQLGKVLTVIIEAHASTFRLAQEIFF